MQGQTATRRSDERDLDERRARHRDARKQRRAGMAGREDIRVYRAASVGGGAGVREEYQATGRRFGYRRSRRAPGPAAAAQREIHNGAGGASDGAESRTDASGACRQVSSFSMERVADANPRQSTPVGSAGHARRVWRCCLRITSRPQPLRSSWESVDCGQACGGAIGLV